MECPRPHPQPVELRFNCRAFGLPVPPPFPLPFPHRSHSVLTPFPLRSHSVPTPFPTFPPKHFLIQRNTSVPIGGVLLKSNVVLETRLLKIIQDSSSTSCGRRVAVASPSPSRRRRVAVASPSRRRRVAVASCSVRRTLSGSIDILVVVSTTAARSADVVTTVNRRFYAPTSFQTSSTSTSGTNINDSDKDKTGKSKVPYMMSHLYLFSLCFPL